MCAWDFSRSFTSMFIVCVPRIVERLDNGHRVLHGHRLRLPRRWFMRQSAFGSVALRPFAVYPRVSLANTLLKEENQCYNEQLARAQSCLTEGSIFVQARPPICHWMSFMSAAPESTISKT